jgi:hypothetical protein
MPFNTLLLISLLSENRFAESGIEVSMTQQAGEKVFFFAMDKPDVRQSLQIQGHLCDGLVFFSRQDEKVLCFVELKGSDLDVAVAQVISTHKQLKQALEQSLKRMSCQTQMNLISWKAYIRLRGGSPKDVKHYKKQLEETFGKGNYDIKEDRDLGRFLR